MSFQLSIITINYNNAIGLEKTIESVVSQNSQDLEYIVVDGNSADESKKIIQKNKDHINNWISEPDSGVYNAMNKGLAMATGKYLLFLNSGDLLANKEVVSQILPQLKSDEDIIYGDLIYSKNGVSVEKFSPPNELNLVYFLHFFLPHPATCIKKDLFDKVGSYKENFKIISDWEFFLRAIIIHGASYKHIDLVISNFDNSGISSDDANKNLIEEEKKKVYDELFPNLKDEIKLLQFASTRRMLQVKEVAEDQKFTWKFFKFFLNIFTGSKTNNYIQKL